MSDRIIEETTFRLSNTDERFTSIGAAQVADRKRILSEISAMTYKELVWLMNLESAYKVENPTKPEIPWNKLDPRWKYVAQDRSGSWFGYATKPVCEGRADTWMPSTHNNYEHLGDFLPCGDKNHQWRDTLLERPKAPSVWNDIDTRFKFLAKDECGEWYAYTQKPALHFGEWNSGGSHCFITNKGDFNPGNPADWKVSLLERPTT